MCLLLAIGQAAKAVESSNRGEVLYVVPDLYTAVDTESGPAQISAEDRRTAETLFQQARAACDEGDVGRSLRLAAQAVAHDPDHAGARRVLGYRRVADSWAGTYASRLLERGEIWHPSFGWIPEDDQPRYEAGERPQGSRWITAEEDTRRHEAIDRGWRVRTDHFLITTNHSREAAAELASRLEMLFQVWQQMFGGYYLAPAELAQRFDGRESAGYRSKPFEVHYYRTRDQYNAALVRQQPRIGMTLGIYFDSTRATHFFAGADQDAGTIYHEAVHQFFQETVPSARNVGALANAWVIEGVACYFESLTERRDARGRRCFTIGTPSEGRLPAARHRRIVDGFYVPLAELSQLGMSDLQRRDDIAQLYSQSAGLATFFMHYDGGRYRRAFVELLSTVYAGRDKVGTLQEATGRSFSELDRQYGEYLQDLAAPSSPSAEVERSTK